MKRFLLSLLLLSLAGAAPQQRYPIPQGPDELLPPGTPLAWYDVNHYAVANGSAIVTFTDRTGNGHNGVDAGTGTTINSVFPSQNGLYTSTWAGGTQHRKATNLTSVYPYTVAAIVNVTNQVATGAPVLSCNVDNGLTFSCSTDNAGGYTTYIGKTPFAVIGSSTSSPTTGVYHLLIWQVSSSAWALFSDGTAIGSGSNATSVTANGLDIGAEDSRYVFKGGIAEVIVYNTTLNSTNLTALHVYAQLKWHTP